MQVVLRFEPQSYGSAIRDLLARPSPNDLGPGQPNRDAHGQLRDLDTASVFDGQTVVDHDMAACCLSGLWLRHDFLDQSHRISQDIDTATGSYWHGIMHRREPDYSNAKYWFRRVGQHPVFVTLNEEVRQLADQFEDHSALPLHTSWDPFQFVDACQSVWRSGDASEQFVRRAAEVEWQLLFAYCYQNALGQGDDAQ